MESETPRVSFITIVDFSEDARWLFLTESVSDLLGFEPRELIGRPALELVHPDEFSQVKQMHYDTIREDKAAALAYLRLKHKDPFKGYILCAVSRTVAHNVLVGSVSFATPGGKALQNISTAQEVEVVTPSAKNFELRRWGDPSPMTSSPSIPDLTSQAACPSTVMDSASDASSNRSRGKKPAIISFNPLPPQSPRAALILDRFSIHCTVLYCSNDLLLSTTKVLGRSFFDFVTTRTENSVRSWIDVIKSWGVNDRGQPSDGGFGFGKFGLLLAGRDSRGENEQDTPLSRRRPGDARINCRMPSSSRCASHSSPGTSSRSRPSSSMSSSTSDQEISVDAIFSGHSDGILLVLRPTSKV
ncbi:uncharacterized protein BJ212DRAFT_1479676 [Suillus subaureus]|uniref:PAS domain-containing protein n=1 Tax=Suillus subaureus TaxID=48587 RepID=A0A9P7JEY8_9AGAM|nr:uncharacterized protein BJ212DRAFT_1479676 [Suillus subaureus]KAG1818686.1 hypothetical protein BJ212DRAFT_1479676 [Suillus subaureus]